MDDRIIIDEEEDYHEESSSSEEDVGPPGPSGAVESPESPPVSPASAEAVPPPVVPLSPVPGPSNPVPPSPPVAPSLPGPLPPPVTGAAEPEEVHLLGVLQRRHVDALEAWRVSVLAVRSSPAFIVPPAPLAFAGLEDSLLRVMLGELWEERVLSAAGDVLLAQLHAYITGYSRLAAPRRQRWERGFASWTPEYRAEQLASLASSAGVWEME